MSEKRGRWYDFVVPTEARILWGRDAARRRYIARKLRAEGYTLKAIAEVVGVSMQRVRAYMHPKKRVKPTTERWFNEQKPLPFTSEERRQLRRMLPILNALAEPFRRHS